MEVHNVTADADIFTSNAWLATGDADVLVDAGAMDGSRTIQEIRGHVDSLDAVVLTHQHGDHVGALDAVLDEFDCPLHAFADHPRRDVEIEDGDTVHVGDEACRVVQTPGHADDHVALVGEPSVYTGDVAVYSDGAFDDGSFGRTDMPGQSRETLIDSLHALLEQLPGSVERMYPGHGPMYEGDVQEVVGRALERAERREPKYD